MPIPSPTRVAYTHLRRSAAPRELADALDTLRQLEILDGELTDVEEAFSHHFRMAKAMDTEVNSQLEALKKARTGLKTATAVLEQVKSILALYPEDKTAQRAVKDADVMARRFQRHADAAAKIIRRLSQKQMPPALKKLSGAVATAIRRRLVNPKLLQVLPWQTTQDRYLSGGHRGRNVSGVEYQAVFRIAAPDFPGNNNVQEMILTESTILDIGPFISSGYSSQVAATDTRTAVAYFLKLLEGWPGVKGEGEAIAGRAATAQEVAQTINSANRGNYDWEKATITADNRRIEGAHRNDDLPKEGAYDMGERAYGELVDRTIGRFKKQLERELGSSLMKKIKDISVSDGEKSWIYTTITLK
jgi:hypothetical protein